MLTRMRKRLLERSGALPVAPVNSGDMAAAQGNSDSDSDDVFSEVQEDVVDVAHGAFEVVDDADDEVSFAHNRSRGGADPRTPRPAVDGSMSRTPGIAHASSSVKPALRGACRTQVEYARRGERDPSDAFAENLGDDRVARRGAEYGRVAGSRVANYTRREFDDELSGSEPLVASRSSKWIKPEKFSGATPVESYLSHFETIAEYNQWTPRDKVAHLKASLTGVAAQLLWDSGDHAFIRYDDLVVKLKSRFGSVDHRERFACQLRSLRRGPGQTLQQLYNEIRRLLALAYPDAANSSLGEALARDSFLAALDDKELEIKIRDREPVDLDSAFRAAVRIETYLRPSKFDGDRESGARGYREKHDSHRARQVTEPPSAVADETSTVLRELKEQLVKSQKAQDEICRELGRVRLLAEARAEVQRATTDTRENKSQGPTRDEANATSTRGRGGSSACYVCGDTSHFARNCPSRQRETSGSSSDTRCHGDRWDARGGKPVRMLTDDHLDRAAYIRMCVQGKWVDCLLDTGSEVCLFPGNYVTSNSASSAHHRLFAANGTAIAVKGEVELTATVGYMQFVIKGLCSNNVSEIILGLNFLRAQEAVWNFKSGVISLRGHQFELRSRDTSNACRRVILETGVVIPPRAEVITPAYVEFKGSVNGAGNWATKTCQITDHVHAASVLLPNRVVGVPIRLLNAGNSPVTLAASTVVTTADFVTVEPHDRDTVSHVSTVDKASAIAEMVSQVHESVPEDVRADLSRVLHNFAGAFSFDDLDIGHATAARHSIDVGDAQPVRQRLRRQPPAHQAVIETHVKDMLRQGIIEPTQSPWAANLVVVRKKSGDFRCCIDFRGLNNVTRKDAYCLPRIDACLDALSGAVWFSTFDLRNSYYQIELDEDARDKTSFICRGGQFRYLRMPMGLCNSGATFQRLVDVTLSGLAYDVCLAYIDDIIVFSKTLTEHLSRLESVLSRLQAGGLKIKPSKSFLLRRSVGFLGHLISDQGISAHPEKTEQITEWATPRCVRDVRAFVGITSYYRKFVKNYAEIASPLTALTAKNRVFQWTQDCEDAFQELKQALTGPPVLAMPTDHDQYILDADSSDFAIGAVLSQIQGGQERVIVYASRHLSPREQNYCVTRRELLAVVYYLKYFRHYLLGAKQVVRVRTDHAAIQWLRRIPEPVGQQARWLETMEEYNLTIEHRAGRSHGNADAMSRNPCHNKRCCPSFALPPAVHCPQGVAELGSHWVEGSDEAKMVNRGVTDAIQMNKAPFESSARVDVVCAGISDARSPPTAVMKTSVNRRAEPDSENTVQSHSAESMHVDSEFSWTNGNLLADQQRADPNISKIIELLERGKSQPSWDEVAACSEHTKNLWRQWNRLSLREGILVRCFEDVKGANHHLQLIMPQQMRSDFLSAVHAGVAGGHFGRHRTELAVKARAYWPGWIADVRRALRTCEACTKYSRSKPPRQVGIKPILCGEPWEMLSLDVTGPHTVSRQGFRFILTMQDHFSKWAEAVPIRRHTAPIVARILFENVIMRYGAPRRILTDQGPEFESSMLAELCRLMRVDKLRTTPYHPECNGMVERMHRVLNAMLAKVIDDDQRDWPDHLPTVMAAYRASVHEATGFTPNRILLGHEIRLPVDLVYGLPPDREGMELSYDEFVHERAALAQADFHTVRNNLGRLAQIRQDKYDTKRDLSPLRPGQKVWYFCPRRRVDKSPKWQNFYTGPYTVVRIVDPHVIIITRSQRSRPFTVHRDKLKPVLEKEGEVEISVQPVGEKRADKNVRDDMPLFTAATDPCSEKRVKRNVCPPQKYADFFCGAVLSVTPGNSMTGDGAGAVPNDEDRPACDVCATTYRSRWDLARHFSTASHQARCAGRSPPPASRRGEGKRDRRRRFRLRPDVDVVLPRRLDVRLVRGEAPGQRNEVASRSADVQSVDVSVDVQQESPQVVAESTVLVSAPRSDGNAVAPETRTLSPVDAAFVGVLEDWFSSMANAADAFAARLGGQSSSTLAKEIGTCLKAHALSSRLSAAWLAVVGSNATAEVPDSEQQVGNISFDSSVATLQGDPVLHANLVLSDDDVTALDAGAMQNVVLEDVQSGVQYILEDIQSEVVAQGMSGVQYRIGTLASVADFEVSPDCFEQLSDVSAASLDVRGTE